MWQPLWSPRAAFAPAHKELFLYLLAKFLESYAYYLNNNILTLFLTDGFGLSDEESGAAFGLRGALSTLSAALLGGVVDRLGVVWSLRLSFAISLLGRTGLALATSRLTALALIFTVMPLGHGLGMPVLAIAAKRLGAAAGSEEDATEIYGALYWAFILGIFLCGPTIDVATWGFGVAPGETRQYRAVAATSALSTLAGLAVSCLGLSAAGGAVGIGGSAGPFSDGGAAHRDGEGRPRVRGRVHELAAAAIAMLRGIVCTRRFVRFSAFAVAALPASAVVRNLDGGIFPKYMVRSFGPTVPKGMIYALNPLLELMLILVVTRRTKGRVSHWSMIRLGLLLAALAPLPIVLLGASLPSTCAFVLVLTAGDMTYGPRMDAYAMVVAPVGHEGKFSGVASAILFLADIPTGLFGGFLVSRFCPPGGHCDGRTMFFWLATLAAATPVLFYLAPSAFVEPDAEHAGGDASKAVGDGVAPHRHSGPAFAYGHVAEEDGAAVGGEVVGRKQADISEMQEF